MPSLKLLVLSDSHFFNPFFYQYAIQDGRRTENPSRLPTDLALGDSKINPFQALIVLARKGDIAADAMLFCGDLTTCADPTAMNLGWLQLNRLSAELNVGEPIAAIGNHDIDSRFLVSSTNPDHMLRYLDPPFPTRDWQAATSFWAHGYCIIDRGEARFVVVNSCSLHGYATPEERQADHGAVPEYVFDSLEEDLRLREPKLLNFLVCHHHPIEIDLPAEDQSVLANGARLVSLLENLGPARWVVIHGHRHLPSIRYGGASDRAPIVFSSGSLAANLHLRLQGKTANQFYEIEVEWKNEMVLGRYRTHTWDQDKGIWVPGQDTRALPAVGGFGYRPSHDQGDEVARLVPPHSAGSITWKEIEDSIPLLRFVTLADRAHLLGYLHERFSITWESESGRDDVASYALRLGRNE